MELAKIDDCNPHLPDVARSVSYSGKDNPEKWQSLYFRFSLLCVEVSKEVSDIAVGR